MESCVKVYNRANTLPCGSNHTISQHTMNIQKEKVGIGKFNQERLQLQHVTTYHVPDGYKYAYMQQPGINSLKPCGDKSKCNTGKKNVQNSRFKKKGPPKRRRPEFSKRVMSITNFESREACEDTCEGISARVKAGCHALTTPCDCCVRALDEAATHRQQWS